VTDLFGVAQVSKPADLSRLGSGERDCLSGAMARPAGPNEREQVSQSPTFLSAKRLTAGRLKICDTAGRNACATTKPRETTLRRTQNYRRSNGVGEGKVEGLNRGRGGWRKEGINYGYELKLIGLKNRGTSANAVALISDNI
jgi:hypothetical protein